jgi:hypothetical protein
MCGRSRSELMGLFPNRLSRIRRGISERARVRFVRTASGLRRRAFAGRRRAMWSDKLPTASLCIEFSSGSRYAQNFSARDNRLFPREPPSCSDSTPSLRAKADFTPSRTLVLQLLSCPAQERQLSDAHAPPPPLHGDAAASSGFPERMFKIIRFPLPVRQHRVDKRPQHDHAMISRCQRRGRLNIGSGKYCTAVGPCWT